MNSRTGALRCVIEVPLRRELASFATDGTERCGLLFGTRVGAAVLVQAVLELSNTARSAERFALDPAQMAAAARSERRAGRELLGAWHTHPTTCAALSAHDHSGASEGMLGIVVGSDGELRAYEHRALCSALELEISSEREASRQARRPQ